MHQTTPDTQIQRDIFSISRLNTEIRSVLEGSFPLLWVEGEISNLSQPRSGHLYYSLKDAYAQVRCAMFRGRRNLLRFQPKNGDKVLIRARVSFYEARGDFQLIAEHMEPAGEGALQRAFEELKDSLGKEGLFEASRKLPLPQYPRRIGIITSPTGAAIHDILIVLKRRFPALPVRIFPSRVQGDGAEKELIQALRAADQDKDCDLLILTRGGGSLEDLSAFNDEGLARTISQLKTPLITAIGHEIDFTIADFVADRRAPTPSAAAELASQDGRALLSRIVDLKFQLLRRQRGTTQNSRTSLAHLFERLKRLHPRTQLEQYQQRLDGISVKGLRIIKQKIDWSTQRSDGLMRRLRAGSPAQRLRSLDREIYAIHSRLDRSMSQGLEKKHAGLHHQIDRLQGISPLATLARGYSILRTKDEKRVISDINTVVIGDQLVATVSNGDLSVKIESIQKNKD